MVPVRGCGHGSGGGFCGVHIVAGAPAHQAGAAHPVFSPTRLRDAAGNEGFTVSCRISTTDGPKSDHHHAALPTQLRKTLGLGDRLGQVTMLLLGSFVADPSW